MIIEFTDLLFSDKLAPITTSLGFIKADIQSVADEFHTWIQEINSRLDHQLIIKDSKISGDLETVLRSLLPLQRSNSDKFLLIPTSSDWTAVCDNGYRGTYSSTFGYLAKRLNCLALWIVARPHTVKTIGFNRFGRQGALIFELYGPKQTEWLNLIRQVRLEYTLGKWEFSEFGEPFPFEHIEEYQAKKAEDKFSFKTFYHYLRELDLNPFSVEFYLPPDSSSAHLIQLQRGEIIQGTSISLQQARKLAGIKNRYSRS
ncbi:MAG: hypothetical protein KAS84_08275 [Anaerolineales bacterium]|nr:hypothetical protein [Anaerolineales bacterium]